MSQDRSEKIDNPDRLFDKSERSHLANPTPETVCKEANQGLGDLNKQKRDLIAFLKAGGSSGITNDFGKPSIVGKMTGDQLKSSTKASAISDSLRPVPDGVNANSQSKSRSLSEMRAAHLSGTATIEGAIAVPDQQAASKLPESALNTPIVEANKAMETKADSNISDKPKGPNSQESIPTKPESETVKTHGLGWKSYDYKGKESGQAPGDLSSGTKKDYSVSNGTRDNLKKFLAERKAQIENQKHQSAGKDAPDNTQQNAASIESKLDSQNQSANKLTPFQLEAKYFENSAPCVDNKQAEQKFEKILSAIDDQETKQELSKLYNKMRSPEMMMLEGNPEIADNLEKIFFRYKSGDFSSQSFRDLSKQLNRLSDLPEELRKEQRILLAASFQDLANPRSLVQGDNKTCGPETGREWALIHQPERVIKIAIDVLTARQHSQDEVEYKPFSGQWRLDANCSVFIPKLCISPDEDSKDAFNGIEGNRTYLGQLYDLATVNAVVQHVNPNARYHNFGCGQEYLYESGAKTKEFTGLQASELAWINRTFHGRDKSVVVYEPANPASKEPLPQETGVIRVKTLPELFEALSKGNELAIGLQVKGEGHFLTAVDAYLLNGEYFVQYSNQWKVDPTHFTDTVGRFGNKSTNSPLGVGNDKITKLAHIFNLMIADTLATQEERNAAIEKSQAAWPIVQLKKKD